MASESDEPEEVHMPMTQQSNLPKKFNFLKNKVALVKLNDYKPENIQTALEKIIELLGLEDFFKNKSVLLKPNLLAPTKNAFTPSEYVSEVGKLLKNELNAKEVAVGDSSLTKKFTGMTIRRTNIADICDEKVYNFFESERENITPKNPKFEAEEHIALPKEIVDADIIINLPKLKTHKGFVYTGAIKNFFGLLGNKMHMHMTHSNKSKFQQMLADIYFAVEETNNTETPKVLTIMDCVLAMSGNGPRNGKLQKIGLLVAGFNSAAVDIVGYTLMNGKPKDLEAIRSIARRTNLPVDISQLDLVGESYQRYVVKDFKKPNIATLKDIPGGSGLFSKVRKKAMSISIKINKKKCILCESCANHCPAQAMTKKNKIITIDRNKCIECFCCGESCPNDAISSKWWLFRNAWWLFTLLGVIGISAIIGIWSLIVILIGL